MGIPSVYGVPRSSEPLFVATQQELRAGSFMFISNHMFPMKQGVQAPCVQAPLFLLLDLRKLSFLMLAPISLSQHPKH